MTDYAAAKRAMDDIKCGIGPDEEGIEALAYLVSLFDPHEGDDPVEARKRDPSGGHCENCKLYLPIIYAPASLSEVARTAHRLCKCPRCFSTKIVVGAAPESTRPPHQRRYPDRS